MIGAKERQAAELYKRWETTREELKETRDKGDEASRSALRAPNPNLNSDPNPNPNPNPNPSPNPNPNPSPSPSPSPSPNPNPNPNPNPDQVGEDLGAAGGEDGA